MSQCGLYLDCTPKLRNMLVLYIADKHVLDSSMEFKVEKLPGCHICQKTSEPSHSHKAQVLILFFSPLQHGLFGGQEISCLHVAFHSKVGEYQAD